MELFNNPKNIGSMNKDDLDVGTGVTGSPVCGDVMQLQIKVENNKIVDAKFKTFGCGSAIASSSYATELLKGMTLDEALELTNNQIAKELELPAVKVHCSVLTEEAIKSAIEDYRKKQNNTNTANS